MTLRSLVFVVILSFGTGCASLAYTPSVQSVGEHRDTTPVSERAQGMDSQEAADVRVFLDRYPDGITPGRPLPTTDPSKYELLGKVVADDKDPALVDLGLWFYSYKEGERWRHGLCDWQVPLSWATLTLWSALSPTYIPCRVGYGTIDTRREAILESLRKAAKAVGGDVVVVEGLENQPEAHLRATLRYTFATGYAFRSIKPKS